MMKPTREQLARLARTIADTHPEELDCDAILELLAAYAEVCRDGGGLPEELTAIRDHIERCPECREEFDALLELCEHPPDPPGKPS